MVLTNEEILSRITQLIAFIEKEADDKVKEIDLNAEEEYILEKEKAMQTGIKKIAEFYEKQEKKSIVEKNIKASKTNNQSCLLYLNGKYESVIAIIEEAKDRMYKSNNNRNKDILVKLILQSLYCLSEKMVVLRCIEDQQSFIQNCADEAAAIYKEVTKKDVEIVIDTGRFLKPEVYGGIEAYSKDKKIKVNCTLSTRINQLSHEMIPFVAMSLFGVNPARKFFD